MECIICKKEKEKLFKSGTCSFVCNSKFQNINRKLKHNFRTSNPSLIKEQCKKCNEFISKPNFGKHQEICAGPMFCKNCKKKLKGKYVKLFCSKSCSATFNNKNKKHGINRSKFEIFIEQNLKIDMPYLNFICNDRKLIGYELDFYFPDIKLAIELNGPIHYEPLYGDTLLERTVNKDKQKIILCYEQGIELIVVDVCYIRNKNKQEECYKKLKELINANIKKLL